MGILVDKPSSELAPGSEDLLLFHLLERFPLLEGLLDGVSGLVKHPDVSTNVVEAAQVAVSGNNLHVPWKLGDDILAGSDHALDTAPAVDVDKREAVADEVIAHVDHVSLRVKDDGISVRVTGRKVKRADVLAVQVNGNVALEGDNRQRGFGRRFVLHVNEPPLPAGPPAARRLRTLSWAMIVEVSLKFGFPPVWSP